MHCGVGEDSWESLGLQRSQNSLSKGNQSWVFIGKTDAEAEAPKPWSPDAKNWLTGKDPDGGQDRSQEEKGTTEDEMAGWDCYFNGHELERVLGVGDVQASLACCSPWDCIESDTTEWTEMNWMEGGKRPIFPKL